MDLDMACLDGDHQCGSKVGLIHRHKKHKKSLSLSLPLSLSLSLKKEFLELASENVLGEF